MHWIFLDADRLSEILDHPSLCSVNWTDFAKWPRQYHIFVGGQNSHTAYNYIYIFSNISIVTFNNSVKLKTELIYGIFKVRFKYCFITITSSEELFAKTFITYDLFWLFNLGQIIHDLTKKRERKMSKPYQKTNLVKNTYI